VDGSTLSGASLSDLVAAQDTGIDAQLRAELDASVAALGAVKAAAEGGMAYDQMLAAGNAKGEALIMGAVAALVTQTASINRAVTVLGASGVAIEGSDSLDNPGAVFQ
jgi:putative iron-regulated protein